MYAFTLEQPTTLADATRLTAGGAQALAGGQTMLASMKQRLMQPEHLVDLANVTELRGIKVEGQRVVIGAMTRHQEVANHAEVRKHIPGLAALADGIGDRQVRAMGTMGGSVANNDPAACYPSAVLGLGATVHTDRRTIAADDFFQGLYPTALDASVGASPRRTALGRLWAAIWVSGIAVAPVLNARAGRPARPARVFQWVDLISRGRAGGF